MAQTAVSSRESHGSDQAALEGSPLPSFCPCGSAALGHPKGGFSIITLLPGAQILLLRASILLGSSHTCWSYLLKQLCSAALCSEQSQSSSCSISSQPGSLCSLSDTSSIPHPVPVPTQTHSCAMLPFSMPQCEPSCTSVWYRAFTSPGNAFSNPSLGHTLLFPGLIPCWRPGFVLGAAAGTAVPGSLPLLPCPAHTCWLLLWNPGNIPHPPLQESPRLPLPL